MANLRILTTPKFENYSCQICGHKLDSKQFPADHIASIHLGYSADHLRDLLLDGPTLVTKHSCCLLPSEPHFLHLNITQMLHIPGLFTCIIIYTHFMLHFYFAIPCWSCRNELILYYSSCLVCVCVCMYVCLHTLFWQYTQLEV